MEDTELKEALNGNTAKVAAIVAPEVNTIAGLTLRPFTAGTLAQLMMTGSKLVAPDGNQDDIAFHVLAFLYIHGGDVAKVRETVMDKAKFAPAVWAFADTVSIKDFIGAAEHIKAIIERGMVGMDYEVVSEGSNDRPNC
jgi:hypothetical protein